MCFLYIKKTRHESPLANSSPQIAHEVVSKRFQPDVAPQNDMLGSFLRHGLTQEQAESEIVVSLYGFR